MITNSIVYIYNFAIFQSYYIMSIYSHNVDDQWLRIISVSRLAILMLRAEIVSWCLLTTSINLALKLAILFYFSANFSWSWLLMISISVFFLLAIYYLAFWFCNSINYFVFCICISISYLYFSCSLRLKSLICSIYFSFDNRFFDDFWKYHARFLVNICKILFVLNWSTSIWILFISECGIIGVVILCSHSLLSAWVVYFNIESKALQPSHRLMQNLLTKSFNSLLLVHLSSLIYLRSTRLSSVFWFMDIFWFPLAYSSRLCAQC